ncbi:MAG TPA: serine hydrolase domain-containing protein, partial [Longimicrobiales bacterium]|nr:serine hydrolase domain-containing protein [Longimicrobiales bacterium]
TTRQPLPAQLVADMSQGYEWSGGTFEEEPFEIITGAAPAGSISSSASDMAKFMLAHLNGGELNGQRILGAETAELMHTRGFEHDARLPGWALGFYESSSHGVRIIGHGGDTQWFHSDLALIPEDGVGVFVSYNTDTGGEVSFSAFMQAFLDHYYPSTPPPVVLTDEHREQASRVAGTYQFNRMSYTTWQKAAGLMGGVKVSADEEGALVVGLLGEPMRMVPVGPLLYREELGHELLAFEEDEDGAVTHAFIGSAPMMVLERLSWFQSPTLHQVLLILCAVIFVATIIAAVRRFFRKRWGHVRPEDELRGRSLIVGIAVLDVAFLVALGVLASDFWALLSPPFTDLQLALALPVIAGLLTIAAIVVAVRHWRSGAGTRGARITYSVVIATSLVFMWSLNMWNLLGWRF